MQLFTCFKGTEISFLQREIFPCTAPAKLVKYGLADLLPSSSDSRKKEIIELASWPALFSSSLWLVHLKKITTNTNIWILFTELTKQKRVAQQRLEVPACKGQESSREQSRAQSQILSYLGLREVGRKRPAQQDLQQDLGAERLFCWPPPCSDSCLLVQAKPNA